MLHVELIGPNESILEKKLIKLENGIGQVNSSKPDLRALVHWEPVLDTDSLGKAAASFYNADNVGKMMVVVEAISAKGNIGYREIEYNIEGKEQEVIIIN